MNNGPGRDTPDDGFDRLLRSALSSDETGVGSSCLDADTLAAWCDGALSPSERSFADAHVARCARCQGMRGVMARTAPADAPSRTWSVRQWFMMLAPAATATTALALWFATTDRPQRIEPQPESKVAMREADAAHSDPAHQPAEAPAVPAPSAAIASADRRDEPPAAQTPEKKLAVVEEQRRTLADAKAAPKQVEAEARNESARDALARQRVPFGGLAGGEKTNPAAPTASPAQVVVSNTPAIETANTNNRVAGYLGNANTANAPATNAPAVNAAGERANALPAPPPTVQPVPSAPPPPPSAAARPDQQQQTSQTFRAGVQTGAGRGAGGARAAQAEQPLLEQALLAKQEVAPSFAFAAPDASVQWRVISQRIIQQSIDKGATWATQYTVDGKPAVFAGSAPSSTVAWIVGRLGIVLKTDDGRTWYTVTFPENVDLVGVAAVDRDTAIVTAADRRVFSTSNGGRSWSVKK